MQQIAESTPFAIPLTISTDPRNSFLYVPGASVEAGSFSKWPEPTGFAAINDPELTRRYADTVRREYMAVGIREALSPRPTWPLSQDGRVLTAPSEKMQMWRERRSKPMSKACRMERPDSPQSQS